jgi:hypothetical protein
LYTSTWRITLLPKAPEQLQISPTVIGLLAPEALVPEALVPEALVPEEPPLPLELLLQAASVAASPMAATMSHKDLALPLNKAVLLP